MMKCLRDIRTLIAGLAAMGALSMAALGHVFWLQPASFRPAPNSVLKLQLRVGDVFPGELVPRNEGKIIQFVSVGPDGDRKVLGVDGADVAGFERVKEVGVSVLGYSAQPSPVTLEAQKFETYLQEKGLEKISALRASRGQSGSVAHEVYSRCAKTMVKVGTGGSTGFDRVLGLRLEIVPENDPFALRGGDELRTLVMFDGKPLANALVEARSPVAGSDKVSARTDSDGNVALRLTTAGMWVVDTVEMIEAEPAVAIGEEASPKPEWHSFWASLCVDIAGPVVADSDKKSAK